MRSNFVLDKKKQINGEAQSSRCVKHPATKSEPVLEKLIRLTNSKNENEGRLHRSQHEVQKIRCNFSAPSGVLGSRRSPSKLSSQAVFKDSDMCLLVNDINVHASTASSR